MDKNEIDSKTNEIRIHINTLAELYFELFVALIDLFLKLMRYFSDETLTYVCIIYVYHQSLICNWRMQNLTADFYVCEKNS